MRTVLTDNHEAMGAWVAQNAGDRLRDRIAEAGQAYLLVATGASQFEVLRALVAQPGIDWSCVHGFHLDEYAGLSSDHPASFCRYLRERFVEQVPVASFLYLDGSRNPQEMIAEASQAIADITIDVALVGVGENGHLAFNDPPADFETAKPYLLVELDEPCRRQQVGEGWFPTLADVPRQAISMSIKQILKSRVIYCSVPDTRKADAIATMLSGPISPMLPASILREHRSAVLVLDRAAASKLTPEQMMEFEVIA
jgi:glucosamine-6-phosphate deaminase